MRHLLSQTAHTQFYSDEDGSVTPFALFMVLIFCTIGGLAVDFNKAVSERSQLQNAADTAAHAALYSREFKSASEARSDAMQVIANMLPSSTYQNALLSSDIEFGYFDEDTRQFVADANARSAVRTTATLSAERGNASRNFLLNLIGWDTFDIGVTSVYATYYPDCLNEGYIAEGIVELQSNNSYRDGFCIHSNTYVSIRQNNYLEAGVTVGMPDLNNLDIASSGFRQNDGLEEALREGHYNIRLLRQMDERFQSLRDGSAQYAAEAGVQGQDSVLWPLDNPGSTGGSTGGDTSTGNGNGNGNGNNGGGKNKKNGSSTTTTTTTTTTSSGSGSRYSYTDVGKKTVEPGSFDQPNRIYQLECSGNGSIMFSGGTYSDFALVTDCDITFSNGTILTGVIIATEGDVTAVQTQMGMNDGCAAGGGAQLWLYGDFKSSANFTGYGAQIISMGDVQFPAKSSGTEGFNVMAAGRIDATSNAEMAFCGGGGMENIQRASLFRMVQ